MKKVSILFMTLDRYDETKRTIENNLANHGAEVEIELLWCDNGSKDNRIHALASMHNVKYYRNNTRNEGVGRGFNQLYLRSTGDYIVLMGNDVLMPKGWLKEMIAYADHVPNSGLIGVQCTAPIPQLISKFECYGHFLDDKIDKVFGVTLFKREVSEALGLFHEEFHPYGLEDSDFNNRVNRSGRHSLYVPNMRSEHIGHDVGMSSEYRKVKDQSLSDNLSRLFKRMTEYTPDNLKEPLPPFRDPL